MNEETNGLVQAMGLTSGNCTITTSGDNIISIKSIDDYVTYDGEMEWDNLIYVDFNASIILDYIRRKLQELKIKLNSSIVDMLNSEDMEMKETAILIIKEKDELLAELMTRFFNNEDRATIISDYRLDSRI